ncbi:MAG: hypothetical protein QOE45_2932 [Frankiaceae bacterium]|jgi:hypothetical protein|nr:hypothetical protein [Frankiaceae bacterium]
MYPYRDTFEARYAKVAQDYRRANEGREYAGPSPLRRLVRRIAAR